MKRPAFLWFAAIALAGVIIACGAASPATPTTQVFEPGQDSITEPLAPQDSEASATESTAPSDPTPMPPPETRIWETDGMVMALIPAGPFLTETEPGLWDAESPQHEVYVEAFWIDQTEVTNAMYAQFAAATGHESLAEFHGGGDAYVGGHFQSLLGADWQHPGGPDTSIVGLDDHPVGFLTWNDAAAYCAWAGKRLPTEAEWEKAARGTDGRMYPWGNLPPGGDLVNFADVNFPNADIADNAIDDGYETTAPVGSYPDGASPYGMLDMFGNIDEWVGDRFDAAPEHERVHRGGSYASREWSLRYRSISDASTRNASFGFRCALSP